MSTEATCCYSICLQLYLYTLLKFYLNRISCVYCYFEALTILKPVSQWTNLHGNGQNIHRWGNSYIEILWSVKSRFKCIVFEKYSPRQHSCNIWWLPSVWHHITYMLTCSLSQPTKKQSNRIFFFFHVDAVFLTNTRMMLYMSPTHCSSVKKEEAKTLHTRFP